MRPASITAVLAGAALGVLAWGSSAPGWAQAAAILMPVLWASASNRWVAALVVMAYTTAASRGLIPGIAEFFGTNIAHGAALWMAAGLFTGLAGWICWHRSAAARVLLMPVLFLALIVPPAGLVGWAHPLTAAGWIFPGAGWMGLVAATAVPMLLSIRAPLFCAAAALPIILALSAFLAAPTETFDAWLEHDTEFQLGGRDPAIEIRRHWAMQSMVADRSAAGAVHVFPETVGGVWNSQASREWMRFMADLPGQAVLVGALEPMSGSDYNNVLIEITGTESRVAYRQRTPIPVGMWRPWSEASAIPQWFDQQGTTTVAGRRVAILLCYEALLVWPVLHSVLDKPEALVSVASTWWAPDSIHRSQRHAMQSWARLFQIPLVEAYNL